MPIPVVQSQGHQKRGLNSNIAIRSMVHKDHKLLVYSGGGLTISSNLEDEYNEISDKLGNIKRTINFFERKS